LRLESICDFLVLSELVAELENEMPDTEKVIVCHDESEGSRSGQVICVIFIYFVPDFERRRRL